MALNAPSTFREIASRVIETNAAAIAKVTATQESLQAHLRELADQLRCYEWFLVNTRRYYHIIDRWVNILIIIVGPIIAVLNSTPDHNSSNIVSVIVTVLAILSSISKGIEKYLNYPRRIAAIDKLRTDIMDLSAEVNRNLRLPKDVQTNMESYIEQIISNFTHICSDFSTISIPPYLYDLFVKCLPSLHIVVLPPEIVSALSPEQLQQITKYIDVINQEKVAKADFVKYSRVMPFTPSLPRITYQDRTDLERRDPII